MASKPKVKKDKNAEARRQAEEQRASTERERIRLTEEEEQLARLRGTRGRLSLLSSAGELGFPGQLGV